MHGSHTQSQAVRQTLAPQYIAAGLPPPAIQTERVADGTGHAGRQRRPAERRRRARRRRPRSGSIEGVGAGPAGEGRAAGACDAAVRKAQSLTTSSPRRDSTSCTEGAVASAAHANGPVIAARGIGRAGRAGVTRSGGGERESIGRAGFAAAMGS